VQPLCRASVRSLRALLLVFAALAALALSATAAGASSSHHPKYLAPPGNPAVTQYLEVVPNAMGSSPPRSGGNPPAASPSGQPSSSGRQPSSLSQSERRKLDHLGPDGKTLANVVQSTAPPAQPDSAGGPTSGRASSGSGHPDGPHTAGSDHRAPSGSLSSTGSQSALSAVLNAAAGQGGGGGMGILLPALMAAGLLSVVLVVLRRRGARRP